MDRSAAIAFTGIGRDAGSQKDAATERGAAAALAALMLVAIGLRLVPVLLAPSLKWPDELFQATEQAHRLVFGTGLVPWEFQFGVRSWLLPGFIAAIMAAARAVGDGPDAYLPAIAVVFAVLGAIPVACGFLWCRRWFGLAGAVVAGAVIATAPDLVYLGGHTLSEAVAAHLLVIALYVIDPGRPIASPRRLVAGGLLIGFAGILRIQLAPALALIVIWSAASDVRARLPAILTGVLPVIVFAAILDTITLGAPLASVWRYVADNIYVGVSSFYGVQNWSFYGWFEFNLWRYDLVLPLALALLGARRMPLAFAAALVTLLEHAAIGHKEYRFIYPAILLAVILASVGLAQVARLGEAALQQRGVRPAVARSACAGACILAWCLVSLQVWTAPGFAVLRNVRHDGLAAASFVARDDQACGIGLSLDQGDSDWVYGSYTYLNRPVPRYWFKDAAEMAAMSAGFNTLITMRPPPAQLGYRTTQCFGAACVARRPGGCTAIPMKQLPVPDPLQ